MIGKADCQVCCCNPPCREQIERSVRRNAVNLESFPPEEYQTCNLQSGCNYKNRNQPNNYKVHGETLEALTALRQKACNYGPVVPDLQTMAEPPYSVYPPQRGGANVRRQADMIDYTPESEFLKRMKQQCEYLRNKEENIFSALDELGFDDYFPIEQTRHRFNAATADSDNRQRTASKSGYRPEEGRSHPKGTRTIFTSADRAKGGRSAHNLAKDKKSEHISRSKKPSYYRGRRKRTSSAKSGSGDRFEPTLKKPHEDSCERCWRYASPARSPVNKPDQKFDPNFRRAHSNPDFERGDGNIQVPSRPQTPQIGMQPYANREGRRPITPTASDGQRVGSPSRTRTVPSQQTPMSQRASGRPVAYISTQTSDMRQPQGKENWQSQRERDMWRTEAARQGYEIPSVSQVMRPQSRQQFAQDGARPVSRTGVSRSQTKMQDLTYTIVPQAWPENKPSTQQTSSLMNYQNYYPAPERPTRPKSCTPGIGYPQGYRPNVAECFQQAYGREIQVNNQRQQTKASGPQSSFVAPGLFCYRGQPPQPCHCACIPPCHQEEVCHPPPCPPEEGFADEFQPDGRPPAGRSQGGRSPSGQPRRSPRRSPDEGAPDEDFRDGGAPGEGERRPDGRSPKEGGRGGRSPGGRLGALASPSQRQTKTGTAKGTPKTPINTIIPGIPHSDSTVYAELASPRRPEDLSYLDQTVESSGVKGKSRTPSPKGSTPKGSTPKGSTPKGKRGKSPKSPSPGGQKSGGKESPKSSKSPKSPRSSKSPKSKSPKSPKSQKMATPEEESAKTKQSTPKSGPKSASRVSSKSPSKSSPKQMLPNLPTSQTSQGPPNEVVCTYEESVRPQTAGQYSRASTYPLINVPQDPCKPTQVIRECCCAARQQMQDDQGNVILCCHCNTNKHYQNPDAEACPAGPSYTPPLNTRPAAQTNSPPIRINPQYLTPPWRMIPQTYKPRQLNPNDSDFERDAKYQDRPKSVRLWQRTDQKKKIPYGSNMGVRLDSLLDTTDYFQPAGNDVNPKTYFVFHMRKCNPGKGNDVEVLVEETAKTCPNQKDKRTKNMTDKMKKIMECPSDSMALRFQKGVSESCKTLQNSRILYF